MRDITQKQLAFYKLLKSYESDPNQWVKVWEFVGEIYMNEINEWGLMSYTTPHRVFELYDDNLRLIERELTIGKTGARYYQYRLESPFVPENIDEERVKEFYYKIIGENVSRRHVNI